jgi:hypothetical protein
MSSNKITITLQANTKDAKKNINDLEKEIKLLTTSIDEQSKLQKGHYTDIQSALKEQGKEREKFAKRNEEIVNNTISNNRKQEESMKAMTSSFKKQLNDLEQLKEKAQATQQALLSPLGGDISKGNAKQKKDYAKTEQDLINHTAKIRALRKELTDVIRSQDYQELSKLTSYNIAENKKLEAEELKSLKAQKQLYTEKQKIKIDGLRDTISVNKKDIDEQQQKLEKLKSQLNQQKEILKAHPHNAEYLKEELGIYTQTQQVIKKYTSDINILKEAMDKNIINEKEYMNAIKRANAELAKRTGMSTFADKTTPLSQRQIQAPINLSGGSIESIAESKSILQNRMSLWNEIEDIDRKSQSILIQEQKDFLAKSDKEWNDNRAKESKALEASARQQMSIDALVRDFQENSQKERIQNLAKETQDKRKIREKEAEELAISAQKQSKIDSYVREYQESMQKEKIQNLANETKINRIKRAEDEKNLQNIKEQYKNTYELTSAQVKYNESKKRLDSMISSGAISQDQYNKGLATEGKLLKENKGSYESSTNAVVRHLRQIETLIVSYYMLKGAWDATIGVGINVNRTIESNTQGIAALITANTRMTTSTGQAVTNQQKFAMSQSIAAETMKKIKTAAIDTAGTFEDLIMIFQQATGQTLSMGNSMGGSIKEIIDNTIQLSKRMANISGAIGQPLDRTREEVRSLLSGNASTDSIISTMLFGSPSEANKAMEKAKASGKDGVKKLLDEMLAPFDVLEGLMTYDIQFNRMKDAYQSLAATTTKPIFDGLTKVFANVANYLTPEKIESIAKSFENVGNAVATVVPPLVQVATYLAVIKGGMLVWNNFLPTIEKLTVGAVDLVRGTGKVTSSMTFASQATGRFASETSNAVKGTGLFATAMATSTTNTNRFTTAVDMSKVGLTNVGGAFTGLMGIMKNNLPMMAMIGAYELYNYTIGKTLEQEENLRNAMRLKLEDIKKLSLAQAKVGLSDLNVGLSKLMAERKKLGDKITAGSYGSLNMLGERTSFGKLKQSEIDELQAQKDTIQAEIDVMYKTKELYEAQVNVASGIQTTAKAFGDLMTEGSATKNALNLLESIKKPLTQAQILQEEIKKLQTSINAVTVESKDKTLDKKAINARLQIIKDLEDRKKDKEKELAEANKKESNKASSILNTEEKKEYGIGKLELEAKLQEKILKMTQETSSKTKAIQYSEMDDIQKLKYEILKDEQDTLFKQLNIAEKMTEGDNKQVVILTTKAKLDEAITKKEEYLLGLSREKLDNEQKGIDLEQKRLSDINSLIGKYTIKKPEDELGLKERLDANKAIFEDSIAKLSSITEEEKKKLDEVFEKSQERFKNENLIKQYKEDMTIDIKLNGFDDVSNSIASLTNGFVDMNNSLVEYNSIMADTSKSDTDRAKAQQKYSTDTVGAYGNMAGAIGSFYKEGSTQAKNFQKVQQAMYMAQMAMQMSALATQLTTTTAVVALKGAEATAAGTAAVALQGTLEPVTAVPRMMAMAALLASFGIIVGGALSGGDKTSTSYDELSAIKANTGTGTVLGDAEAGSESISKSLEILSDLAKPEHNLLAQMNKSLISIDNKIGGVTSILLQKGGFALGEGYTGGYDTGFNNKVGVGTNIGGAGAALGIGTAGLGYMAAGTTFGGVVGTSIGGTSLLGTAGAAMPWVASALIADKLLLDGAITKALGGAVNSIAGGLFGKTSQSRALSDAGLIFGEQLITKAKEDFEGSAYQTIATTTTKKSWFSKSTSTSYTTYTEAMSEEIRNQFELILDSMYDTVVSTGDMLDTSGQSIMDRLDDYAVKLGKISLKGKSGEEIQELLGNVFGKTMDEMVTEAYAIQDFAYEAFNKTIADFKDITQTSHNILYNEWGVEKWIQDSEGMSVIATEEHTSVVKSATQQLKEANDAYDKAKSDAHTAWLDITATTLDGFVKAGETISQTLTRVSSGMEVAEYYISRMGAGYEDIKHTDIIDKQGDVDIEIFKQSVLNYEKAFYNSATGIDEIVKVLGGTIEDVVGGVISLNKLREQFKFIGEDINGITTSMVEGAGGVGALSDAMSGYFENFLTDAEQNKFSAEQMTKEFEKLGIYNLPKSNEGFKQLVSSIDLTTKSGQELYGRVMLLADGFAEATQNAKDMLNTQMSVEMDMAELQRKLSEEQTKTIEVATDKVKKLSDAFTNMGESIEDTIANLIGNTQDGQSQSRLIQDFWGKSDEIKALRAKGIENLTETESSKLQDLVGDINQLAGNIQSAQIGDNTGITNNLISELDGLKNNLDFDNKIIKSQIVDANGNVIGVAEETGIISSLVEQLKTYNSNIESQLSIDKTLTFDDFKAGGLLDTQDEIAFRQSFEAKDFTTFNKELEDLRNSLSYLSLSTTDTAKHLDDLSRTDTITFENLKEFSLSTGTQFQDLELFTKLANKDFKNISQDKDTFSKVFLSSYAEEAKPELLNTDVFQKGFATYDEVTKKNKESAFDKNYTSSVSDIVDYIEAGKKILSYDLYQAYLPDGITIFEKFLFNILKPEASLEEFYSKYGGVPAQGEIDKIESAIKDSLKSEGYELPSFAKGTPYLPSDMVIQAHEREMIIDPQSSDVLRKYGIKVNQTPANNLTTNENKGIIEAINKQTEEVKKLNSRMEKIELLSKDTRDNTERMAIGA